MCANPLSISPLPQRSNSSDSLNVVTRDQYSVPGHYCHCYSKCKPTSARSHMTHQLLITNEGGVKACWREKIGGGINYQGVTSILVRNKLSVNVALMNSSHNILTQGFIIVLLYTMQKFPLPGNVSTLHSRPIIITLSPHVLWNGWDTTYWGDWLTSNTISGSPCPS